MEEVDLPHIGSKCLFVIHLIVTYSWWQTPGLGGGGKGQQILISHSVSLTGGTDGVQLLQLIDKPLVTTSTSSTSSQVDNSTLQSESEEVNSSNSDSIPPESVECTSLLTKPIPQLTNSIEDGKICKIGAVSVGEVLLKTLQFELEKLGVSVEYKLIAGGAILLCAGQVIVRKENENDFVVEGPPCQAYFQIKNAIYRQFAFI